MPIDRGAIDAQLREIGEGERWWDQREFRDLPYVMSRDEQIRGISNGRLLGPRRPRIKPSGTWLFVVTNERLLCLQQLRFARKQVDVLAGQVTHIRQGNGIRSYQIVIETGQRKFRLRIPKPDAFRFVAALAPLMPSAAVRQPYADLEPISWIPGISTVAEWPGVAAIVSRVSMLSPPDYATRDQVARLEAVVEGLQGEVERLQQHVTFLEDLLQQRTEETLTPPARVDR
jgi:hypothetical protein